MREGDVVDGKYRIERALGAGAMGEVFAAHHLLLDRTVAIKFLRADAAGNARWVARFVQEARAAARLESEHVARVLDVAVIDGGAPYIVMEYLEGYDLAEWLVRRGRLAVEEAVDFVLQTCDALAEAHDHHIVHRDVKPANLFAVQRAGAAPGIKVLDFGISKMRDLVPATMGPEELGPASRLTEDRALLGSVLYMSPEQMAAPSDVDPRADIWALGITLCELLTGKPPFEGQSIPEVCFKIASPAPLRLRDTYPDLPPGIETIILKCLERSRERRYTSVTELAMALVPFGSARAPMHVDRMARAALIHRASPATTIPVAGPVGRPAHAVSGQTRRIVSGTLASEQPTTTPKERRAALDVSAAPATIRVASPVAGTLPSADSPRIVHLDERSDDLERDESSVRKPVSKTTAGEGADRAEGAERTHGAVGKRAPGRRSRGLVATAFAAGVLVTAGVFVMQGRSRPSVLNPGPSASSATRPVILPASLVASETSQTPEVIDAQSMGTSSDAEPAQPSEAKSKSTVPVPTKRSPPIVPPPSISAAPVASESPAPPPSSSVVAVSPRTDATATASSHLPPWFPTKPK